MDRRTGLREEQPGSQNFGLMAPRCLRPLSASQDRRLQHLRYALPTRRRSVHRGRGDQLARGRPGLRARGSRRLAPRGMRQSGDPLGSGRDASPWECDTVVQRAASVCVAPAFATPAAPCGRQGALRPQPALHRGAVLLQSSSSGALGRSGEGAAGALRGSSTCGACS